ncbi:MAG: hypothetical protein HY675_05000 [Chloroflexi bacterium]|nr:hypothetical protein [Chloroflexota bacterium]
MSVREIVGKPMLLLLLLASALVILLAGSNGGSSSNRGRETSVSSAQVDASQTVDQASGNQSGAASEESGGRSKIVRFMVPTIT